MEASDCPANKAEPGFCENQNEICCYGGKCIVIF